MRSTRDRGAQGRSGCIPQITLPAKRRRLSVRCACAQRDPSTGVHTQEVEPAWSSVKTARKTEKGLRREDLQSIWMSGCDNNMERGQSKRKKIEVIWPFCPFNFQRILQFLELLVQYKKKYPGPPFGAKIC